MRGGWALRLHFEAAAVFRVERVTRDAEVLRLSSEWEALWHRVPNATPFQSPRWLLPWWERFGNATPRLLAVYSNGSTLAAVFPLYVLQEAGCRKLLPFGISLSDYIDALIDPEHPEAIEVLLQSLVAFPDWDQCYIPELAPSAALLSARCPTELTEDRVASGPCPVLSLPSQVDALREVVPRKTLRDLRQVRRRTAAAGELSVARADAASVAEIMHEFFRLHERRWQRLAGHGVCDDTTVRAFHLDVAQRMLEAGMLRLYLLRLGQTPLAAYYGFAANGVAHAYLSGFDPDRAELSLGTQIVGYAIEEAVREGAREFHFLRGGEAYKYAWGAVDRINTARAFTRRC